MAKLEALLSSHDEAQGIAEGAAEGWRQQAEVYRYAEINREAWEEISAFLEQQASEG